MCHTVMYRDMGCLRGSHSGTMVINKRNCWHSQRMGVQTPNTEFSPKAFIICLNRSMICKLNYIYINFLFMKAYKYLK